MQYYYIKGSKRLGPINADQLRSLSSQGVITGDTIVETEDRSVSIPARKVKGLEFPSPVPEPPVIVPLTEPKPVLYVNSDWTKRAFDPIAGWSVKPKPETDTPRKTVVRVNRARIDAARSLSNWCDALLCMAWLNFFASMIVGLVLCSNASKFDGGSMMMTAGVTSIVGGIIVVILFSFLAALGRYIIARDE